MDFSIKVVYNPSTTPREIELPMREINVLKLNSIDLMPSIASASHNLGKDIANDVVEKIHLVLKHSSSSK